MRIDDPTKIQLFHIAFKGNFFIKDGKIYMGKSTKKGSKSGKGGKGC